MFDNAGKKLETLTEIVFWVEVIGTIIATVFAITLCMSVSSYYLPSRYTILLLIGILAIACANIFLWYLICLTDAAFAQLVSNTAKSAADTGKIVSRTEHPSSEHGQTVIVDNSIRSSELPDL